MKLTLRHMLIGCALVIAFLTGAAWADSQGLVATQPMPSVVLSGADIGFRMHGRRGDTPVGELVVRVDGEWKAVQFAVGVKPVKK